MVGLNSLRVVSRAGTKMPRVQSRQLLTRKDTPVYTFMIDGFSYLFQMVG